MFTIKYMDGNVHTDGDVIKRQLSKCALSSSTSEELIRPCNKQNSLTHCILGNCSCFFVVC